MTAAEKQDLHLLIRVPAQLLDQLQETLAALDIEFDTDDAMTSTPPEEYPGVIITGSMLNQLITEFNVDADRNGANTLRESWDLDARQALLNFMATDVSWEPDGNGRPSAVDVNLEAMERLLTTQPELDAETG